MLAVFLLSVGAIAYTYGLYPLLVAVLGVLRPRTWRRDEDWTPPVSLIVSACNEAGVIHEKLLNSLALDYPAERLQIIVASESSDEWHLPNTEAICREVLSLVMSAETTEDQVDYVVDVTRRFFERR